MKLTELLAKAPSFAPPSAPSLNSLLSAANRILSKWPDIVADPPERDREKLVQAVNARFKSGDWRDTKMSLVTSTARALFDLERRSRPDLSELRDFYYSEVAASKSQTFLGAMLSVYLGSYEPSSAHTKALAKSLGRASDRLGARGRRLLETFPECLYPTSAPDSIAQRMLLLDDCWTGLKELGISAPHAPGIMDYAHQAYVRLIGPRLNERAEIEKLFRWLKPEKTVRISGADVAIAAILRPWLKKDPDQTDLTFITENLVGLYGDPRVNQGGVWAGVPKELLDNVLLRWLTGENIRFFLDVVSASETSHMWEPRRKFWLGLHEQNRIDAAWVAFSDDAARYAKQQIGNRGDRSLLRFGHQADQVNGKNISLLILKIGNKIIVEGSHNYKVHVFRANLPNAPQLYQDEYNGYRIRMIEGAEAKIHDVHGSWQGWILERI